MTPAGTESFLLQELAAPPGWTAALLLQPLPVDDDLQRMAYRDAVGGLLAALPPFAEPHPEDVFLLFNRLRPQVEIKLLQSHARGWMPQFGVGIWLHSEPPQTWTRDEFEAAEPGTLRPVIERVVRVQADPGAQRSAWQMLLGSGSLIRVSSQTAEKFVQGTTDFLLPTIADPSLTSFPFYIPLLRGDQLRNASAAYDVPPDDQLPGVEAYVRESVEDGGLLLLLRQAGDKFWAVAETSSAALRINRLQQPAA